MKKCLLSAVIFLLISLSLWGQKNTVSGYIRDGGNGETLIGATILVKGTTVGTSTNEYGFYSLSLDPGNYVLISSYVGFADQEITVDLGASNQKVDIDLSEEGTNLDEVVVVAREEDQNVKDIQMSVERLDMSTIEKLPTLLGETDVLRSIQLLPGVTTVGEGSAGFNV
ncbi:MAG: carboxypeptidase-like regulatory domain-containing protein, partial [Bacteroidota bacterium]